MGVHYPRQHPSAYRPVTGRHWEREANTRDLTLPSRAASERAGNSGCHLVPTAPGGGLARAGESPTRWPGPHAQAGAKLTRCCESREPRRARRSPEPAAVQNSGVYSYSTLGKQHTQFLRLEELVLLSSAKFLLLDGQWQLGLDVHDGPLHHHEAVLVQQIRKEQGLWSREEAGDESVVPAPLCLGLLDSAAQSSPAAGSGLAATRGIALGVCAAGAAGRPEPTRSQQAAAP